MIEPYLKRYFPYLKYFAGGFALLVWVWVTSSVTIRSCGGPFPDRTRGPFAKSDYTRLGELPEWENMIARTDEEGRNFAERFILGLEIPVLEFGDPPPIDEEPAPEVEPPADSLEVELPDESLAPIDAPLDATP